MGTGRDTAMINGFKPTMFFLLLVSTIQNLDTSAQVILRASFLAVLELLGGCESCNVPCQGIQDCMHQLIISCREGRLYICCSLPSVSQHSHT